MGTTSEKLTYLNDTKQLLKENINNLGGNLTNEPFRQYASVLEGIYESLPKVSGIGASLSLSPSLMGKIKLNEIQGDTYQQTYNGNQLIDFSTFTTSNSTYSFTNDVLTVQSSGGGYNSIQKDITTLIKNNAGKTIRFKCNSVDFSQWDSSNNIVVQIVVLNNGSYSYPAIGVKNGNNITQSGYIIPNDTSGITSAVLKVYTNNTGTVNTTSKVVITKPLIYLDDNSSYEPYVGGLPSPNPDYPQEIKSVTGLQNVEKCGKNLLDTSSFYNGYVDSSGNIQSTGVQALFNYIRVNPGESYTISSQGTVNSLNIAQYDINKNFISRTVQSNNPRTFTLGNTTYYIRIWTKVSDDTPMTQEIVNGLKLQLEQGSTATTYEPYKGNAYEVNLGNIELNKIGNYEDSIKKSTGKNLFNLYDKTTTNYNGVDVTIENGELTLNGTTTSGTSILGIGIFNHITDITYTCSFVYESGSCTDYGGGIFFSDTSTGTTNVGGGGGFRANQGRSFTLNDIGTKPYYAYMVLNNGTTYTNYKIRFQIEQNSQATTYEPYGKVWYKTYNTGEKTFNGSETWETQWNGDNIHGWRTTIPNLKQTTEGSQSSYVISDYYEARTQDENFSTGSYGVSNRTNQSQIIIKNNDILNQNDFKTWLGTHNVKVKYQLATPTYTVITNTELIEQLESLNNAKSENGTTNINVTSEDLSMILNVGVLKGDAE